MEPSNDSRPGLARRTLLSALGAAGLGTASGFAQSVPGARGIYPSAGATAPAAARTSPPQDPIPLLGTDMHVGPIRAVAVSGDGTVIATGGTDKTIRLWKAATGAELLRLYLPVGEGSVGVVDALAFSPDARRLYAAGIDWATPAGSLDGAVYVFDLTAGKLTGLMAWAPGFGSRFETIAVAPSGAQIALAGASKGLLIRETAAPGFTRLYSDPPSLTVTIASVAYAPDGRLLATAASNGRLRLLEIGADGGGREVVSRALPGGGRPASLAFSPDSLSIAVGYGDRPFVHVVPLRANGMIATLTAPAGASRGNLAAVAWGRDAADQGWLYAGGTIVDAAGRNLLLGWREGRAGTPAALPVAQDSITRLVGHPAGGVVFASSDPRWGHVLPGRDGQSLLMTLSRDTERMDFRGIASRDWGVDAGGTMVTFRARSAHAATLRFDLAELTLTGDRGGDAALVHPSPLPGDAVAPPELGFLPGSPLRSVARSADRRIALYGGDDYLVLTRTGAAEPVRRPIATAAWGVAVAGDGKIAVAAHGDGTIRWYALDQDLTELGGLFVTADAQRWVVWRTDGRFAHSARGGARLVGFLQNGMFQPGQFSQGGMTGHWIDVDRLYGRLYDPDRVRAMLAVQTAESAPSRAEIAQLDLPSIAVGRICAAQARSAETRGVRVVSPYDSPPSTTAASGWCQGIDPAALQVNDTVTLPAGTRAIDAQLRLTAAQRATQMAAFVNGQNVGTIAVRHDDAQGDGPLLVDQHVPLFPGENRIEFRAYGTDARSFSRAPIVLRVTAPEAAATAAPAKPRLHVLIAGIDRYQGTIPSLRFARADAETFATAIQTRAARQYDLAPVAALYDADATLDAVTAALGRLAVTAQPEDAVVIYFSGHGVVGTDDRSYAFVTVDVTDANAALQGGLGVTADQLSRALAEVRAERTFLFLDTCHAGGFDPRAIGYLNQETGRYVLAASTGWEEEQDSFDGINGVFAYSVKQSLKRVAASDSGAIDALDLGRFVTAEIEEMAHANSWQQRAIFQAAGQIAEFPLFAAG